MLPHVVRYNSLVAGRMYGDLAADAGLADARDGDAAEKLVKHLTWLVQRSGQPVTLQPILSDRGLIPRLAEEAAAQWTGNFNPRPVDAASLEEIYRCALHAAA